MTILEAVNELLEAIGEAPVGAVETGQATDAGQAETILMSESKEIQLKGWAANTQYEREYTPSGASQIALASPIIRITPSPRSAELLGRVTIRNGYLHDTELDANNQWTGSVWLDTITLVDFAHLPESLARYIAASAAQRFQMFKKRDSFDAAVLGAHVQRRRVAAEREDTSVRGRGVLNTASAHRLMGHRHNPLGGEAV